MFGLVACKVDRMRKHAGSTGHSFCLSVVLFQVLEFDLTVIEDKKILTVEVEHEEARILCGLSLSAASLASAPLIHVQRFSISFDLKLILTPCNEILQLTLEMFSAFSYQYALPFSASLY